MSSIANELRNSELIRFLNRYCQEYNKRNLAGDSQEVGASIVVKEETVTNQDKTIKSESVIIGLQGGIVSELYKSSLIGVEPLLAALNKI